MRFFSKLSIKINLLSIFVFVLITLISLFTISFYKSKKITEANEIYEKSLMVKNYTYRIGRDEYKFREFGDLKLLDIFHKNILRLNQAIVDFDRELKKLGLDNREIGEIKLYLKNYQRFFDEYLKKNSEFGIDGKSGLLKDLEIAKDGFLVKNSQLKGFSFREELYLLEINVKDFLRSRDTNYADKFGKNYDFLKSKIRGTVGIHEDIRAELSLYVDEYRRIFIEIVELSTIIGSLRSSGIVGEMRNSLYNTHQKIDVLINLVDKYKIRTLRRAERNSNIASIILSLILIILTHSLLKRFEKSSLELEQTALNLSLENGDLSKNLAVSEDNSFKILVSNLNRFVEIMRETISKQIEFGRDRAFFIDVFKKESMNTKDKIGLLKNRELSDISTFEESQRISSSILMNIKKEKTALINLVKEINTLKDYSKDISNSVEKTYLNNEDALTKLLIINESLMNNIGSILTHFPAILFELETISTESAIEASKFGEVGENLSKLADRINVIHKRIEEDTSTIIEERDIIKNLLDKMNKALLENSAVFSPLKANATTSENLISNTYGRTKQFLKPISDTEEAVAKIEINLNSLTLNSKDRVKLVEESYNLSLNAFNKSISLDDQNKKALEELENFKV
jgi:hypothetical protein